MNESDETQNLDAQPQRLAEPRTLRILVAEDHAVNQQLLTRMLEKRGHCVSIASTGNEAVGAAEQADFDLVLMDVQMPELDGISATEAIRQGESGTSRRVPIVAMTAHVGDADRERCLEAGMNDFLSKPVASGQLDGILSALCDGADYPHSTAAAGDAAHSVDSEILVQSEVLQLLDGDSEAIGQLIDVFLEEADKLVLRMRGAINAGNPSELYLAVHTLNGSAANFYARQTQQAASELEEIAMEKRLDEAPAGLANVETALGRLRPALAAMRKVAQA